MRSRELRILGCVVRRAHCSMRMRGGRRQRVVGSEWAFLFNYLFLAA